jgi:hypothetical protein
MKGERSNIGRDRNIFRTYGELGQKPYSEYKSMDKGRLIITVNVLK